MELIENQPTDPVRLPEPEQRYHTAVLPPAKTEHGQSIVRILAAILGGLILVVLIVLLARWIYHKAKPASVTVPSPGITQRAPAAPQTNSTDSAQPSTSNSGAAATASPGNPTATPPATNSTNNSNLPNSGPGDVAEIFAAVSLAAGGLHYIASLRRFNRTGI